MSRLIFLLVLALSPLLHAQLGPGKNAAGAMFRSEQASIAPGEPFTVSVFLPHPEGWHSYYQNSGGVELPPSLQWSLPDGFTAGPIQWPVPEVFESDFGRSIGYAEPLTLLVEITPPASLQPGNTADLALTATWQYCQPGKCVNDTAELSLSLPVAEIAQADPDLADHFAAARASLPEENDAWTVTPIREGTSLRLRLEPGKNTTTPSELRFIPDQPFIAPTEFAAPQTEGGALVIPLRQAVDFLDEPVPLGDELGGILVAKNGSLLEGSNTSALRVTTTAFAKPPAPPLSFAKFLPVLGGMLLGGFILNLMPCVFPVIGLKIMGFVQQAGQARRKIVLHGVAFTVGVLVSFWVVAGVLFALRSSAGSGEELGWGYQLQNPWIVLGLMLLMFVLGLAMYGVFELGTSATGVGAGLQNKQGFTGSFFSGVLATIVATPCSAPFLGAAIGASIALPAVQFFTAFTVMALGLALPYLILSLFPRLIDFLPRPGAWMESFKQAMSFLLFATAGFLLWVYAGQIGLENLLLPILGLTLVAIAAWVLGRWDAPARRRPVRWIAKALALAFAVLGFLAARPPKPSAIAWETWSPERVEELLAEGTPVYVDFTAQWCATCQLNKKRAYPDEVAALMAERGIVALKADKTNPSPQIDAALEQLGRTAIPVNVLYVPDQEPVITPEILSADYLKDLFSQRTGPL